MTKEEVYESYKLLFYQFLIDNQYRFFKESAQSKGDSPKICVGKTAWSDEEIKEKGFIVTEEKSYEIDYERLVYCLCQGIKLI